MKYLTFIFIFLLYHTAFAEFQIITLQPDLVTTQIGDPITLTVQYDVSNGDSTLQGIGIAVHFDSDKLHIAQTDISNLFSIGLAGVPLIREEGDNENDHNEKTDKVIIFFWSYFFGGNWPNQKLPLELAHLRFTVNKKYGNTAINITPTTLSNGYEFQGTSSQINILKIKGDINSDGILNIKDLLSLLNLIGKI